MKKIGNFFNNIYSNLTNFALEEVQFDSLEHKHDTDSRKNIHFFSQPLLLDHSEISKANIERKTHILFKDLFSIIDKVEDLKNRSFDEANLDSESIRLLSLKLKKFCKSLNLAEDYIEKTSKNNLSEEELTYLTEEFHGLIEEISSEIKNSDLFDHVKNSNSLSHNSEKNEKSFVLDFKSEELLFSKAKLGQIFKVSGRKDLIEL